MNQQKSIYKTETEWKESHPISYFSAQRKKLLLEIRKTFGWEPLVKHGNNWTIKENCINEAKKYRSKTEWAYNSGSSYNSAQRNGWLIECTTHMRNKRRPIGYWNNKTNCIEEAKKYNTNNDWKLNGAGSYAYALKNSWMYECTIHMIVVRKIVNRWIKLGKYIIN